MKKIVLPALILMTLVIGSCKKDSNGLSYVPHFIDAYTSNCIIYDTRDMSNVKRYDYAWDNILNKFVYYQTIDTTGYKELKLWPAGVTDPVGAGYSSHFLDRSNGSTTYLLSYGSPLVTSTQTDDYPGFPSTWEGANKVDAYCIFYELYGASNAYSQLYFDFPTGTYLFAHGGTGYVTGNITDLVKTPNGNQATDPIDWTKADAAFAFVDPRYADANAIIFIDYDEMKYVELTREDDLAGGDSGRHNLRTTTWHPLTELFDTWKF